LAYVPAGKRAEQAVVANPEKSDRAIAEEIGVSHTTVQKARKATGNNVPVAKRVGKDGKARKMPIPSFSQDDVDEEDGATSDNGNRVQPL
jgi:hypothetical protein